MLAGRLQDNEVGDVSLGFFTMKKISRCLLDDDKIAGDLSYRIHRSKPLACQIQVIALSLVVKQVKSHQKMIAQIDKSKSGEVVFKQSKSIKTMKVRRIYDVENQSLLYLSYTTKETEGSLNTAFHCSHGVQRFTLILLRCPYGITSLNRLYRHCAGGFKQ
ncbi:CreA family protein [Vibrio lentus]|nr:CreA family protein [Vibrio lentus]